MSANRPEKHNNDDAGQPAPKTLGMRLRSLRGQRPRDSFAAVLGVHKNTLARYETDERRPDAAFIRRVCDIFDVAPDWFLTGQGEPRGDSRHDTYHAPRSMDGAAQAPMQLHADWLERVRLEPEGLMLMTMTGDSMWPTLNDGDLLLVQPDPGGLRRDGIYLMQLDGALTVKRLHRATGRSIQLLSDNSGYPPIHLDVADLEAGNRVRALGRVVWQFRQV